MFEHGTNLLLIGTWEPLDEIADRGATRKVLEQCGAPDPRDGERPCTSCPFRVSLHRRAGRPVRRGAMSSWKAALHMREIYRI